MIRTSLSLLLLFALTIRSEAQSLSPTVIASGGGFVANGTAMLSSTVGEMTMVETFSTGSAILTQGFQQPEDLSTGIGLVPASGPAGAVFPNPVTESFTLLCDFGEAGRIRLLLTDALGRAVLQTDEYEVPPGTFRTAHDASRLASGIYFLQIRFRTNSGKEFSSTQKLTVNR